MCFTAFASGSCSCARYKTFQLYIVFKFYIVNISVIFSSCPTAQDPFGLTTGFTRADVDVRKNGLYNMETEAFVFASGGPGDYPEALKYFVRCYLKYCHGNYDAATPANNDQVCENVSFAHFLILIS